VIKIFIVSENPNSPESNYMKMQLEKEDIAAWDITWVESYDDVFSAREDSLPGYMVVLSDDVILIGEFKKYLNVCFDEFVAKGGDLLILGSDRCSCVKHPIKHTHAYNDVEGHTIDEGLHAFIISSKLYRIISNDKCRVETLNEMLLGLIDDGVIYAWRAHPYIDTLSSKNMFGAVDDKNSTYEHIDKKYRVKQNVIYGKTFLNGINLQNIADFIIDDRRTFHTEYVYRRLRQLRAGDIIWCKNNVIPYLFTYFRRYKDKTKNKYILISHDDDYPITKYEYDLKPECISRWFSCNVDYSAGDLIPMPLGFEKHASHAASTYVHYEYLLKNKNFLQSNYKNDIRLYCNFSIDTNKPVRGKILNNPEKHDLFIDCRKNYIDYINTLSSYKFVVSPPGNGIDCYRTWETLYVGSIPIVEKHMIYESFKTLPFIMIDDWDNLDLKLVLNKYDDMKSKSFSYAEMTLQYWCEQIQNAKENIHE
jgi:hypothetical protein